MCICVFKPKEVTLTKATLRKCFNNNPDGAGFAYPDDKGKSMVVQRGFFGFRKFWRAYREVHVGRPMLIHFRIATSGYIDEENCHPFLIDKRHAFIHNGNLESQLGIKPEDDSDDSDTKIFVETKLQPLFADSKLKKKRFWASASFKWLMEETINTSKMAILDATGFEMIYNAWRGEREFGAWFSNKSYKEDRKSIRNVKTSTAVGADGKIKEIQKAASGRTRITYTNRVADTSKQFILKDAYNTREKQNEHLTTAQDFMAAQNCKVGKSSVIDMAEIY